jgi:hypothetical protein
LVIALLKTLLTALLIWLCTPVLAQQTAAELRSVTGMVFAQPATGQVKIVQAGAKLLVGDTVGTHKGAFALVVFNDGSRVALRPESAIAIRGFSFKPEDPANDQMSVQLLKGWLRNVSGQIGKRGNEAAFEMKVNDTTIGIRGTDFGVRLCDEECAAAPEEVLEGVLPQSGRLGRVLATNSPLQRLSDGVTPVAAPNNAALFLGDVVTTAEAEALLGLDDGTRIVLAPRTEVALRAEQDERGRRAIRIDLRQGALRVATPPAQPGVRLYGLLVNAGELLAIRPDAALDMGCESPAGPADFACASASVVLRRGQSEVLTGTGLRSLRPGVVQRLADPTLVPATPTPNPTTPGVPQSSTFIPAGNAETHKAHFVERDIWSPEAHPKVTLRTLTAWREQQAAMAGFGGWYTADHTHALVVPVQLNSAPAPRVSGLFDPLDLPREAAQPPSAAERAQLGVYTAVFSGQISLSNPLGQILVAAGEGGFAPLLPTAPPRPLPASPRFMELDRELERGKLFPGQCPK